MLTTENLLNDRELLKLMVISFNQVTSECVPGLIILRGQKDKVNNYIGSSVLLGSKALVESLRPPHPGTEWHIYNM